MQKEKKKEIRRTYDYVVKNPVTPAQMFKSKQSENGLVLYSREKQGTTKRVCPEFYNWSRLSIYIIVHGTGISINTSLRIQSRSWSYVENLLDLAAETEPELSALSVGSRRGGRRNCSGSRSRGRVRWLSRVDRLLLVVLIDVRV